MDPSLAGILLYALTLANIAGIYAVLCLGLNLQWGVTGLFNAGIAGFFAVGAHASAILTSARRAPTSPAASACRSPSAGRSPWRSPGFLALRIGAVTPRLRSDDLATGTIGIAEIARPVLKTEEWMTDGVRGITTVPRPFSALSPMASEAAHLGLLAAVLLAATRRSNAASARPSGA